MAVRMENGSETLVKARPIAAILTGMVALCLAIQTTQAVAMTTAWTQGHHVKTRLVTGADPTGDQLRRIVAVHMRLDPGWKTYWRNPGNSGGIPPSFDLSGSTNLASFTVRYPVPKRYEDQTGTTFGFKGDVMFPIEVIPRDPGQPIELKLNAFFGVCEEICIPVELALRETLLPAAFRSLTPALASTLANVPLDMTGLSDHERNEQPRAVKVIAKLDGDQPHLVVHAQDGVANTISDVLPVPHGDVFMGIPKRIGGVGGGAIAYRLPLMSTGDAKRLRGGAVDLVVIGKNGATKQTFEMP